jgi:hypothetical protein
MARRDRDPRSFLPLTPLAFQALLALADSEKHGYAIMREIDAHTGGRVRLRTGTLVSPCGRSRRRGVTRCAGCSPTRVWRRVKPAVALA